MKNEANLSKLPGSFLVKIAGYLPPPKADLLLQIVSDMRLEYYAALQSNYPFRANGIRFRYYLGLTFNLMAWITAKQRNVKINRPPFSLLLEIADWLPQKYGEILIDEVDEMRRDYFETLKRSRFKARARVVAYYLGLVYSGIRWMLIKLKDIISLIPKM